MPLTDLPTYFCVQSSPHQSTLRHLQQVLSKMLMVALLKGLVGFGPMPHPHLSLGLSGGAFIPGFQAKKFKDGMGSEHSAGGGGWTAQGSGNLLAGDDLEFLRLDPQEKLPYRKMFHFLGAMISQIRENQRGGQVYWPYLFFHGLLLRNLITHRCVIHFSATFHLKASRWTGMCQHHTETMWRLAFKLINGSCQSKNERKAW